MEILAYKWWVCEFCVLLCMLFTLVDFVLCHCALCYIVSCDVELYCFVWCYLLLYDIALFCIVSTCVVGVVLCIFHIVLFLQRKRCLSSKWMYGKFHKQNIKKIRERQWCFKLKKMKRNLMVIQSEETKKWSDRKIKSNFFYNDSKLEN